MRRQVHVQVNVRHSHARLAATTDDTMRRLLVRMMLRRYRSNPQMKGGQVLKGGGIRTITLPLPLPWRRVKG